MYSGFPVDHVGLLRCLRDGETLEIEGRAAGETADRIVDGALRCVGCGARFPVRDGIVRMLDSRALDATSRHERMKRDEEAASYDTFVADPLANEMEMQPTIDALGLHAGTACVELGCGTGRYTVHIAPRCRAVVAIDFSGESLRVLARKVDGRTPIGLVQADVTTLRLAPQSFDAALSTLVSNLPTAKARTAMYQLVAEALAPRGRFVFGTHHHSLRQRLDGVPKEGAYTEGGIYRYCFGRREIAAEVRRHYRDVNVFPVQIPVPLGRRLGLPVVRLSRLLGYVPLINQTGNLLLVTARHPILPAGTTSHASTRHPDTDPTAAAAP